MVSVVVFAKRISSVKLKRLQKGSAPIVPPRPTRVAEDYLIDNFGIGVSERGYGMRLLSYRKLRQRVLPGCTASGSGEVDRRCVQ